MWTPAAVVVCALELLGRDAASFPPIQLVDAAPPGASSQVEAYVRPSDGTIYVLTSTPVFQRVLRAPYRCRDSEALRKLASILAHEEWHVRNGSDEAGAYGAQLAALLRLGARHDGPLVLGVQRSMIAVAAARSPRRTADAVIAARRRAVP